MASGGPHPLGSERPARSETFRRSPGVRRHRALDGVEANARLTASTGGILVVLLAAEGATILRVRGLLGAHVFLGMMLIPPVALKIGTTCYRFVRYYTGHAAYRHKGPPPAILRLVGPAVVVLTAVVLASGVALVLFPSSRSVLLNVHRLSFIAWFIVTTVHVLGHLGDTARLAPLDWVRRPATAITGTSGRRAALIASLVVGVGLGALLVGRVGPYLAHVPHLAR